MKKRHRATLSELAIRINKIYQLLINSWTYHDILRYVENSTEWGVSPRQVDEYIAKAKEKIIENAEQTQEEFRQVAKNKFADLYKKAMSQGELTECRRIIETENKVLGYENVNIQHSVDNDTIKELKEIFDKSDD